MKRNKIAILGALIVVVSMVMLLLPLNALFASSEVNGVRPVSGCITVIKTDPAGNLLAGTGFTLYHSSGNQAVPEGFTDGSGMITFCGLPPDTYTVRETTTPAGFGTAPDQTVTLDLIDHQEGYPSVTVNFVDDPIPRTTVTRRTTGGGETPPPEEITVLGVTEELPFTGQSMWLYIIGAAMLALAGGLTFALRAVKSKA